MLAILRDRTYRHLFAAQVIALLGTGLMTVALGLLAYDLAGADAGAVLGTALAIKMIAYVGVAPVAQAFTDRLPRRSVLVALDLVRGAIALCLPFVTEIWQIYLLIFLLQAASAAFTPTFQATIPDILPKEEDYTRALSLSRLAYDLESLVSPIAGGGASERHQLSQPVCRDSRRVFRLGCAGPQRPSALAAASGKPRGLGPDHARHAPLSGDSASARIAGDQSGRRGGRVDGDREHGRAGQGGFRSVGAACGAGPGSVRCGIDGRRPDPAASSGPTFGPAGV